MKRKLNGLCLLFCIVIILGGCRSYEEQSFVSQVQVAEFEENLSKWGLGSTKITYVSNNKDYEWYIDQEFTGKYAGENCGPSTVAMAVKWWDEDTLLTPEKAREKYQSGGGWWYTNDIEATLKAYRVPFDLKYDFTINQMKAYLLKGKILIICADMRFIPQNKNEKERTDRFYPYDDGHFFIIKGYAVTEKGTYFEVYDPNNWSLVYEDGKPMGKNRFYHEDALLDAIKNWWYGMFVIGE